MNYFSTRDKSLKFSFKDIFLRGLAPDGGLFLPEKLKVYNIQELNQLMKLSYIDLATEIIHNFCSEEFEKEKLKNLIEKSYKSFDIKEIVNLKPIQNVLKLPIYILELYHGPTLAFKDIAMQVIGNMYDELGVANKQKVNVVVATSGDTGSAAISALNNRKNINLFVLHPHNKISKIQRKIMTTIGSNNIHNIAIEGSFDDCQNLVKTMFNDNEFRKKINMSGVNSINWARIMCQIVYYFYAALKLGAPDKGVSFSVPTGNFGDIYAGYLAKCMGLSIDRLIVATNKNDILHRFISRNEYSKSSLSKTFSPSMDILVSSNFERYLYDLFAKDASVLCEFMEKTNKEALSVTSEQWTQMKTCFDSSSVDDNTTCDVINELFTKTSVLVDPHTAVGVKSGRDCSENSGSPIVTLATAHPAKFSEAIQAAGLNKPELPGHLKDLFNREERYTVLPNELSAVVAFIRKHS